MTIKTDLTKKIQRRKKAIYKQGRSARGMAVEILNRIERAGAYAEPLLDSLFSGSSPPDRKDRGLITELVYGTLRNKNRLDWAIAQIYFGNFETMETPVRNILRTGIYQLLDTNRIPPFAIVNEAVEIAKHIAPAASGLVNAALHTMIRNKEKITWPDPEGDAAYAISINHSHPLWMVERWVKLYGTQEATAICRANNEIPPFTLRANILKMSREELIKRLKNEGFSVVPTQFSPDGIIVYNNTSGLRVSDAFSQGLFRIQDEASQLVAHLLAPQPGEQILDSCAGTGGKTLHIAALMLNSGKIVAADINRSKLAQLRGEAKRLGITMVETAFLDSAKESTARGEIFDRVLVDAPCSGLGTLRRNPEIRWRMTTEKINSLHLRQTELLKNAARKVKIGGYLAYCVCTTTPEETRVVIADFLKSDPRFTPVIPVNIPRPLIASDGFMETFPHRHSLDGFFGALFIRK